MGNEETYRSPLAVAWSRLRSNRLALFGIFIILGFLGIAILGPLIRKDASPKANEQFLELARQKPGFSVKMLYLPKQLNQGHENFLHQWIFGMEKDFIQLPIHDYKLNGNQLIVERFTGNTPNLGEELAYPLNLFDLNDFDNLDKLNLMEKGIIRQELFLLGTDRYGRDLLSRLMAGTWISFSVGLISIMISLLIGLTLGAMAGYFRGRIDDIIMWLINVVWSIPTLLLVIAITLALGKGFWQVFVAVGLTMWVEVARVVRGQVIGIREMEFIEAGKALGYSTFRIILRHVLPNVTGPVIVISAANFSSAILIEAGLSFLGLGAQPPQATWGKMISEHKGYIITGDAYLAIFPGIAIFLLVLSFVLLGNGLRDAFDAKSQKGSNL